MHLSGSTERTTTTPAPSPVNLEPKMEVLTVSVHTIGALLCVLVFWLAWQGAVSAYDADGQLAMSGRRFGSLVASLALICGAGYGAYRLWTSFLAEIADVRTRRKDWHNQLLWERRQQGGVIIEEERTDWSLHVQDTRDLLLIVLYIYMQVRSGKRTPWSIDNLTGSLYFGDETRDRLLGKLTEHEARKVGDELARLGFVRGRAQKSAGQWVPEDADHVLDLLVRGIR